MDEISHPVEEGGFLDHKMLWTSYAWGLLHSLAIIVSIFILRPSPYAWGYLYSALAGR